MLMPAANSPLPTSVIPSSIVSPTTATVTIPSVSSTLPLRSTPVSNSSSSTSSQKDTTHTKLFVGGLPYHTTDKSLREHFEVFGEIEEAVVITDRTTGKSRGYGFVIMQNKEDAERACKEPNPIIDGRKANVNLAFLGAKPRISAINGLTLGSLRQYPTLLQGHIGDYTALAAAGQLAAAPTAGASALTAAAVNAPAVSTASLGPGKARSSMSLQLMSGRLPQNTASTGNPYIPSLYATPYALQANQAGLISLAAQNPLAAASTGNPLLDAYANQYAAALAAAAAYSNPGSIASMNGMDATTQQAGLTSHGNYIQAGYAAYAPLSQIPAAAYGAAPTAAPSVTASQTSNVAAAVATDARIQ